MTNNITSCTHFHTYISLPLGHRILESTQMWGAALEGQASSVWKPTWSSLKQLQGCDSDKRGLLIVSLFVLGQGLRGAEATLWETQNDYSQKLCKFTDCCFLYVGSFTEFLNFWGLLRIWEELMLSNCGAGEDSWESLGQQENQTIRS